MTSYYILTSLGLWAEHAHKPASLWFVFIINVYILYVCDCIICICIRTRSLAYYELGKHRHITFINICFVNCLLLCKYITHTLPTHRFNKTIITSKWDPKHRECGQTKHNVMDSQFYAILCGTLGWEVATPVPGFLFCFPLIFLVRLRGGDPSPRIPILFPPYIPGEVERWRPQSKDSYFVSPVIFLVRLRIIVSPVRSTYGGYYGLVVATPPRPHFIVYAIT